MVYGIFYFNCLRIKIHQIRRVSETCTRICGGFEVRSIQAS
jgi:hypothetical protein